MKYLFGGRILSGQLPEINIEGNRARGVIYIEDIYEGNIFSVITYAATGDQQCAVGEKYYDDRFNLTSCEIFLGTTKTISEIPHVE